MNQTEVTERVAISLLSTDLLVGRMNLLPRDALSSAPHQKQNWKTEFTPESYQSSGQTWKAEGRRSPEEEVSLNSVPLGSVRRSHWSCHLHIITRTRGELRTLSTGLTNQANTTGSKWKSPSKSYLWEMRGITEASEKKNVLFCFVIASRDPQSTPYWYSRP